MIKRLSAAFLLGLALAAPAPARAAQCGGDFSAFIAAMSREAAAAGVSRGVIERPLPASARTRRCCRFDRRQRGTFRQSFEQYSSTRVVRRSPQARAGS